MHSRKTKFPAKFGQPEDQATINEGVPATLLKQARRSGQLNLSGRGLKTVPSAVWHVNSVPVSDKSTGASFDAEDRWWDQTDLVKLILASNELSEVSEDIALLPALSVLDVSMCLCVSVCVYVCVCIDMLVYVLLVCAYVLQLYSIA